MRQIIFGALIATLGSGYGWSLKLRPVRAAPEVAAQVQFPQDWPAEASTRLEGPAARALMVALEDFTSAEWHAADQDDPIALCLGRPEMYDVTVMRGEAMTFVRLVPNLSRCAVQMPLLDGGGEYAIRDDGVILSQR